LSGSTKKEMGQTVRNVVVRLKKAGPESSGIVRNVMPNICEKQGLYIQNFLTTLEKKRIPDPMLMYIKKEGLF
jgi:hypothetical protein